MACSPTRPLERSASPCGGTATSTSTTPGTSNSSSSTRRTPRTQRSTPSPRSPGSGWESCWLRWRDVDFAKRLVHVRWSHVQGQENRPKSHRVRSVPLIDQAARALDGLSRREHFTALDDLVFVNTVGRHVDGSALRRRYLAAAEAAGLRRLRFHDLRHTFGTLAVQAFPLTDVKAYMGHANIETTMVYVHHRPAHDAADRLSALVAAASPVISAAEMNRRMGVEPIEPAEFEQHFGHVATDDEG